MLQNNRRVSLGKYGTYLSFLIGDRNAGLAGVVRESDAPVDIDQAKWFLRVFAGGNKLNTVTVSELYLSGYIGIELLSPGKEPLPTDITEKGKRVLET